MMNNNMQHLMKQAQKLQGKLAQAQAELEDKEVTGESGAGLVKTTMTLRCTVKSISIDKSVINPDDREMLEDLVVASLNDAKQKADHMFEEGMREASGGMDLSKLSGGMF